MITYTEVEVAEIIAQAAKRERDAAWAVLNAAGIDTGWEDGDPPTAFNLSRRISILVAERDEARADERARIVAWLETHPRIQDNSRYNDGYGRPRDFSREMTTSETARAIERGEHNSPDRGKEK